MQISKLITRSIYGVSLIGLMSVAACSSSSGSSNTTNTSLQGLATCEAQSTGTVCGTLLAPDGSTPIANAEIALQTSTGSLVKLGGMRDLTASSSACLSDATGGFACVCDSVGAGTYFVSSSIFTFTFTATCTADAVTDVPAALTTASSSNSNTVAVVTGLYDKVEIVLADMLDCGTVTSGELEYGTECNRMHIFDGGSRIGSSDTDPNNGGGAYRTIDDLLTDSDLMADYDVILLNCGLDTTLANDADVIANLQAFVAAGGKVYASDWAYDFVEQAFPTNIDFYDTDSIDGLGTTAEDLGAAHDGGSNSAQTVNIENTDLLTYLRAEGIIASDATTASINFNLGIWAVMSDVNTGVEELLTADSLPNGPVDAVPSGEDHLPIATLHCNDSEGGIFYGSYHTEIGDVTDAEDAQEAILRWMILNGFNSCIS